MADSGLSAAVIDLSFRIVQLGGKFMYSLLSGGSNGEKRFKNYNEFKMDQ